MKDPRYVMMLGWVHCRSSSILHHDTRDTHDTRGRNVEDNASEHVSGGQLQPGTPRSARSRRWGSTG